MQDSKESTVQVERMFLYSAFLGREVILDLYLPLHKTGLESVSLLLINDGQDLPKFQFDKILFELQKAGEIEPLFCVGIHCSEDRRMEYGTASLVDYLGRGAKAGQHHQFVLEELLPHLGRLFNNFYFKEKAYAGFSLGGLSAIDAVWHHPYIFSRAGVFSGSLWWRLKDLQDGYDEDKDRIIHKLIREGNYHKNLKFYFTTGSLDEKMDRNNNGIIDSIDDTLGLIKELENKGYKFGSDILYKNYENGRHDVFTWGKAMPDFLRWGWANGL